MVSSRTTYKIANNMNKKRRHFTSNQLKNNVEKYRTLLLQVCQVCQSQILMVIKHLLLYCPTQHEQLWWAGRGYTQIFSIREKVLFPFFPFNFCAYGKHDVTHTRLFPHTKTYQEGNLQALADFYVDDIICCWGGQNNASSRSRSPRDQHWCY